MDNNRFLHCEKLCADTHLTNVWRLADGRLFTVSCLNKHTFSDVPVSQYIIGFASSDEGKTWKQTFFHMCEEKLATESPVDFLIDRDGRIHIFIMRIRSSGVGGVSYMRVDNAEGDNMFYQQIGAITRYTGSMNNAVQLDSGRIIAPFSLLTRLPGCIYTASVVYSDDGGDSWKASNDVPVFCNETESESGALEPVVIPVEGALIMIIRTVLNRFWYAVSYDDGATWSEAKPTKIPSSNAPAGIVRMPNGRIVLAWNNVLGEPMRGVQYSFARQCLYAAVTDDGLRTLRGARIIVRKRADDPDKLLNCYPLCSPDGEDAVFINPFGCETREGATWSELERISLRLKPDDLLETGMRGSFSDWITDCDVDASAIRMTPTVDNVAYAIVNFPYAQEGKITLHTEGALPVGTEIHLSDCYLDRMTFLPEKRAGRHAEIVGKPYVALTPAASGTWEIVWDAESVTLTSGDQTFTLPRTADHPGFNHLAILFEGENTALTVTGFDMQRVAGDLETGIEY